MKTEKSAPSGRPKLLPSVPKYFQVRQALERDILAGVYPPHSKIPSVKQLVAQYGVSTITAVRVMNELVKSHLAYTVQGKGCFVAGEERRAGALFAAGNEPAVATLYKRIILVMPDVLNEFYGAILKGVLDVVQPLGYTVETYNSESSYTQESMLLARCLETPIAGLLLIPVFRDRPYQHVLNLRNRGVPVVVIDNRIDAIPLDFVSSDNIGGARTAVQRLLAKGHRRILFVGRGDGRHIASVADRFQGYREAFAVRGVAVNRKLVVHLGLRADPNRYGTVEQEIRERVVKWHQRERAFTAVFAANDWIAVIAMLAFRQAGVRVPEDVSIVGFDGSVVGRQQETPLATVKQDAYQLGYHAARILLARRGDGAAPRMVSPATVVTKLVPTTFLPGRTIARPPSNAKPSRKTG